MATEKLYKIQHIKITKISNMLQTCRNNDKTNQIAM